AWLDPPELASAIAAADATLGIFGATPKALRVVPNKVYQCMALGAPIITAATPGVADLLRHDDNALLVPPGDAEAIAEAVMRLRADDTLGRRLGASARATFEAEAAPEAAVHRLIAVLEELARPS